MSLRGYLNVSDGCPCPTFACSRGKNSQTYSSSPPSMQRPTSSSSPSRTLCPKPYHPASMGDHNIPVLSDCSPCSPVKSCSSGPCSPISRRCTCRMCCCPKCACNGHSDDAMMSPRSTPHVCHRRIQIDPTNPAPICIPKLEVDPIHPAPGIRLDRSGEFARSQEKDALKCLNDRFASFIDKVRYLEHQNRVLETQWQCLQRRNVTADADCILGAYTSKLKQEQEGILAERPRLQSELSQTVTLVDELKSKYQKENDLRIDLENEYMRTKSAVDESHISKVAMETRLNELNSQLEFLRHLFNAERHEMEQRVQDMTVTLELEDTGFNFNLESLVDEVRANYGLIASRSRQEVECWYKSKITDMNESTERNCRELRNAKSEIEELRHRVQRFRCEMDTLQRQRKQMESAIQEAEERGQASVREGKSAITTLEDELAKAKNDMARHVRDYQELMNIKLALDVEIATYRKLLEGEENRMVRVSQFSC